MSSDHVLVTGATGMIGSSLIKRLRSIGSVVTAVGRRRESAVTPDVYWQLGTPLGVALSNVDTVVHLAARVHVRGVGFSNRQEFIRDNVDYTLELAKEAHAFGVRRFVFVSSIGVLGASSQIPLDEGVKPRPHNAYTASKYLAEQSLKKFCDAAGMDLVILRFPAVIGSMAKGNVSSLVQAVKLGFPLPISLLENKRQFIALSDLVEGIIIAATHSKAAGHIFHLAGPERMSTLGLCKLIASELGVRLRSWPLPIVFLRSAFVGLGRRSLADGLTANLLIDTSKANDLLGWRAAQSIRTAVAEVLKSVD